MSKKISKAVKDEINKLYNNSRGLSLPVIAKKTRVSYSSVYGLIGLKKRGFASLTEYQTYLAKEQGFDSLNDYKRHLAKQKGFTSLTDYYKHLAKEQGFDSFNDYKLDLVRQRGFASRTEYELYLKNKRRQRQQNKELSDLVKGRLKELKRTREWLADQIGVSSSAVTRYAQGEIIPRSKTLYRLLRVLEVKKIPKSLENLIED